MVPQNYCKGHLSKKLEPEGGGEKGGPKHHTQNDYHKAFGGLRSGWSAWTMAETTFLRRQSTFYMFPGSLSCPIVILFFYFCLSHSLSPWGQTLCLVSHCISTPSIMLVLPNARMNWSTNRYWLCLFSPWLCILSSAGPFLKWFVWSPCWMGSHSLNGGGVNGQWKTIASIWDTMHFWMILKPSSEK